MNWDHLFDRPGPAKDYDDASRGPLGRADAALLGAILNYVRPRTAVEYGSLDGHSTAVLARFADTVYAVEREIRPGLRDAAAANPNVAVCNQSMRDFVPPAGTEVGVCYYDASHDFEDSKAAYLKIKPFLAPECLIVIHDTGTWNDPDAWGADFRPVREAAVRGERAFVGWLQRQDCWTPVSFASRRAFRHGLTVLQREDGWDNE